MRVEQRRPCRRVTKVAQDHSRISFETDWLTSTNGRAFKMCVESFVAGLKHPFEIEPRVSGPRLKIGIGFRKCLTIVRADFLAVIATKYPTPEQGTQSMRDGSAVLNGEV